MIMIRTNKLLIIIYTCLNICSSIRIPYVRIGNKIILLDKHNNNVVNTKNVIANSMDRYDKNLELINMLLKLLIENQNTKQKPINTSIKTDNGIYTPDKHIKNIEMALREDGEDTDLEDISKDDNENNSTSSEEISEERTIVPVNDGKDKANYRYRDCYGSRNKCVRACRDAYEDACYTVRCPRKLRNKLRSYCRRECSAWF